MGSTPGRPWRLALRGLAVLLVGWLVVDKVAAVVTPEPTVGHWRSAADQEAYRAAYEDVLAPLPRPTAAREVVTDFGVVHVLEWRGREPGPPVVLMPGHSSGAPMWAENLPDLIGRRTVYALDPLGDASLSSQRLPLRRFEDQAEWASQTIAGLGVDRVHLVGHSFGGANAAILAVRHPDQVATLTLLEPVMVIHRLPVSAFFWASLTQLPVPRSWRDRAFAEIGGTTVAEVRARTPMSVMIDRGAAGYATALPMPRSLTDEEWHRLRMPVRVDIAGRSSLAGGRQAAGRIRALLPHASVTVWPQATHSLPMQEHATLDPQLLAFWGGAD